MFSGSCVFSSTEDASAYTHPINGSVVVVYV